MEIENLDKYNLSDQIKVILEEVNSLDELYDELKEHFENIKSSAYSRSLNFIKDQSANLIALKKTKLEFIKEINSIKRFLMEFDFKKERSLMGDEDGNTDYNLLFKNLLENMTNNKVGDTEIEEDIPIKDKDIDDELENNFNKFKKDKEQEEKSENNEIEDNKDEEITLAVDLEKETFYEINSEDEIIEEYKDKKIFDSLNLDEENSDEENEYYYDNLGNVYLSVSIDE